MTASALALAAGLLAYAAASGAFVGYRLGPMVKSWARSQSEPGSHPSDQSAARTGGQAVSIPRADHMEH